MVLMNDLLGGHRPRWQPWIPRLWGRARPGQRRALGMCSPTALLGSLARRFGRARSAPAPMLRPRERARDTGHIMHLNHQEEGTNIPILQMRTLRLSLNYLFAQKHKIRNWCNSYTNQSLTPKPTLPCHTKLLEPLTSLQFCSRQMMRKLYHLTLYKWVYSFCLRLTFFHHQKGSFSFSKR